MHLTVDIYYHDFDEAKHPREAGQFVAKEAANKGTPPKKHPVRKKPRTPGIGKAAIAKAERQMRHASEAARTGYRTHHRWSNI